MLGESRITQARRALRGVDLETEAGLQHREGCGGRPRLRRTRHGIEDGSLVPTALHAAVELGQASQVHVDGRVEYGGGESRREVRVPIPREPERDQRIVVRPDRSIVIRGGIEASLAFTDGADTPPGEELRRR